MFQYLVKFSLYAHTGGHTMYWPIVGLLPPTCIELTQFPNSTWKLAGLQVLANKLHLALQIFLNTWHKTTVTWASGTVALKKVFLEISQNSQENTCDRDSFLIKLAGWCFCILQYLFCFWKIIQLARDPFSVSFFA